MTNDLQRTLICVELEISQPWAVGGVPTVLPDESADADAAVIQLPALVNPLTGGPHLPATSLVGALRAHLTQSEAWLGPAGPDDFSTATPSPLRCLGTQLSGNTTWATRQSTAIDPHRRAASPAALRTEQVVDPGAGSTLVVWWLQLDYATPGMSVRELLDELLTWRPVVGRRRGVGRGQARVVRVGHAAFDLADEADLTWWLQDRGRWTVGTDPTARPPSWRDEAGAAATDDGRTSLTRHFLVQDPLHLGTGQSTERDGHQVATTRRYVPGTTWRGVFRSRVAHILRVTGHDNAIAETTSRLFGSARTHGSSDDAGHRGALRFADSRILPEDDRGLVTFTHISIDRVTGGTRNYTEDDQRRNTGALFTVEAIPRGLPVELVISWDGDLAEHDRWLLECVITDLADGTLGIGGLTTRGYGTLTSATSEREMTSA